MLILCVDASDSERERERESTLKRCHDLIGISEFSDPFKTKYECEGFLNFVESECKPYDRHSCEP